MFFVRMSWPCEVFFPSCMLVHVGMYEEMMMYPRRRFRAFQMLGISLSLSLFRSVRNRGDAPGCTSLCYCIKYINVAFFLGNPADGRKITSWIRLYRTGLLFLNASKKIKISIIWTRRKHFSKITVPLPLFFVVILSLLKCFVWVCRERLDCHSV